MKCEVCQKKEAMKNVVICSEKCGEIRLAVYELLKKYTPTNGCDNCWGDLHQGCSEQCNREFRESRAFGTDIWKLVRLIIKN